MLKILTYDEFEKKVTELFCKVYNQPLDDVVLFIEKLKENNDDYLEALYTEAVEDYKSKEHRFDDEYLTNHSVRLLEMIY